ncbi:MULTISPECIES: RDD family protein [unclassified Paenibacillus]|uniref:RDD family protein n=1 Tax=unclassified Paenibacillus TaxID=185978 RepID=UPI0036D276F6
MNMTEEKFAESLMKRYGSSLFFKRWGATVIDFIFLACSGSFLLLLKEDAFFGGLAIFLLYIILYYVLLEGLTGYTVGKRIFQIRAINADGKAPGFVKGLIRSSLRIVDTNPFLLGALPAGISVLISSKKQRVGDMAADTYVANSRDLPDTGRQKPLLYTLIAVALLVVTLAGAVVNIAVGSKVKGGMIGPDIQESFVSSSGKFELSAGPDWTQTDIYEGPELAIENLTTGEYAMLIAHPKDETFTLNDIADFAESAVYDHYEDVTMDSFENVAINGHYGFQYQFNVTTAEGDTYWYLSTIIETDKYFLQLYALTPLTDSNSSRQELKDMANSLQVVAP